tara:strand:- start:461 stop:715 length:255 start_codon:yes stop_codon:yes gene_type:complete
MKSNIQIIHEVMSMKRRIKEANKVFVFAFTGLDGIYIQVVKKNLVNAIENDPNNWDVENFKTRNNWDNANESTNWKPKTELFIN